MITVRGEPIPRSDAIYRVYNLRDMFLMLAFIVKNAINRVSTDMLPSLRQTPCERFFNHFIDC
jgi:hypothetical protein